MAAESATMKCPTTESAAREVSATAELSAAKVRATPVETATHVAATAMSAPRQRRRRGCKHGRKTDGAQSFKPSHLMISPLDKHGEGTGGQPDCSGSSLKGNESFILYKPADCYCGNNPGPMRVLPSPQAPLILTNRFRENSARIQHLAIFHHVCSRKVYWGCKTLCTTIHIRHILIPITA
jgi:hypothetical protein